MNFFYCYQRCWKFDLHSANQLTFKGINHMLRHLLLFAKRDIDSHKLFSLIKNIIFGFVIFAVCKIGNESESEL